MLEPTFSDGVEPKGPDVYDEVSRVCQSEFKPKLFITHSNII